MCEEGVSLPQERLQVLRQAVHDQVNKSEVLDKIQNCIEQTLSSLQSKSADEVKVMKTLEDEGVIDDILSSLNLGIHRPRGQVRSRGESSVGHEPACQCSEPRSVPEHLRVESGASYLLLHVRGGRAFLDYIEAEEEEGHVLPGHSPKQNTFTLHVFFKDQRYTSQPVRCSCEPAIRETFLLSLSREDRKGGTPSSEDLLASAAPIRLVLVSGRGFATSSQVVGGAVVEWRRVLTCADGRLSLPVELRGGSVEEAAVTVGLLDLQLQLAPPPAPPLHADLHATQLRVEENFCSERERLFLAYAKAWWKEYLQIRGSHAQRLVKIFAADETGRSWPVFVYVHPLRACQVLESPRQAARFVSLLAYQRASTVGSTGGRGEVWHRGHTFLAQRKGGCEDHAALLCSLLLGFGLQAFVCLGTKARGQAHAWVMTLAHSGEVTFWESLTGQRFQHHPVDPDSHAGPVRIPSPAHPYRTVGCVFNHRSFLANIQPSDGLISTRFGLANPAHWKAMNQQAIDAARGGGARTLHPPVPLLVGSLDPVLLGVEAESRLREGVVEHRRGLGLGTVWSPALSYILSSALAAYEMERLSGVAMGTEDFQQAVRLNVPEGHTFKAFPIQFIDVNTSKMFASCIRSDVCHDIISCRGDQVQHALRCRVYRYPEDTLAVWIMMAVQYQSVL